MRAINSRIPIACLPDRKLKSQNHKNILQLAMCSWPCDRAHMQTLDSKTCIEPLRPPHSQITILTTAFTSWISLNLIPGHSHCFFFLFFSYLGGAMGKAYWSSRLWQGDYFPFVKTREATETSLHPEQVPVRKEVGHNEYKEFLCFAQELGNQQLRVKQSIWLVGPYWIRISHVGKRQRARERKRERGTECGEVHRTV